MKVETEYIKISDLLGVFNQDVVINPIPFNNPTFADVPVVQLKSDKNFELNFARKRIDFFMGTEIDEGFDKISDQFSNLSKKIFDYFKKDARRIAILTRHFFITDNRASRISNLFSFDPKAVLESESLFDVFLRFTVRDKIQNLEINNYTSIEKLGINKKQNPIETVKGILITRDINTLEEKDHVFADIDFERFFSEYKKMLKLESFSEKLWPKK